ncbi:MAG: hypothetical protein QNI91_15010 [Arenicellales bacterium]|nr:hypothetical protein [Arenicellales bacterium]
MHTALESQSKNIEILDNEEPLAEDLEEDVLNNEEHFFIWDDGLTDSDDDSISALVDEFSMKTHSTVPAWQRIERYKEELWLRRQLNDIH